MMRLLYRAHYLDAKSIEEYGVYMPRDNPTACFVVKSPPQRHMSDEYDMTPATPPGTVRASNNAMI